MEKLIEKLKAKYPEQIKEVKSVGKAEINVELNDGIDPTTFTQTLQDHLIEIIDALSIYQVNIVNHEGKVVEGFATNQ